MPDYSYAYLVIKRAHLVVHVLRCVNGLNECLHVKARSRRNEGEGAGRGGGGGRGLNGRMERDNGEGHVGKGVRG